MSTTHSRKENHNYYIEMAGEFYVLAQLYSRRYMAVLTYGSAKKVDILVSAKSGKMFRLEVKTTESEKTLGSDKSQFDENYEWGMTEKHEDKEDKDLYYCFVILRGFDKLPRFFIVSGQDVAQYLKDAHQHYLKVRKKETPSRNISFRLALNPESSISRKIPFISADNHENRWDILPE